MRSIIIGRNRKKDPEERTVLSRNPGFLTEKRDL